MAPRRNAQSTTAEISLVHLKNCLVNLPGSLVSLLVNVNTPAQNVIVELSFKDPKATEKEASQRSVYLGWTGLPSKRKVAPIVGRDGIRSGASGREQEIAVVELDTTLARTLGLTDGLKVNATVHVDPPLAHTVNIEPLTYEDWEIIELHATFLELNLLSQIRALPNPAYTPSSNQPSPAHPLTVHLSPTSTANIKIVSLDPPPPTDSPFAKIEPNAEVIVAPKERAKSSRSGRDSRSVTSKRSSASTAKRKQREERKQAAFFRGLDVRFCKEWFDGEPAANDLRIWVDEDLLLTRDLKGVNYVDVSVVRPAGLQAPAPVAPEEAQTLTGSTTVVAKLCGWEEPPDGQTIAISTPLCSALGFDRMAGGVIKVQPALAPSRVGGSSRRSREDESERSYHTSTRDEAVQQLKIYPFSSLDSKKSVGLRFGGESTAEKEEEAKRVRHMYGDNIFKGPLTDGLVLGVYDGLEGSQGWEGGIMKFDPPVLKTSSGKELACWCLSDRSIPVSMQAPVPRPKWLSELDVSDEKLDEDAVLVGIDSLLGELKSHLSHMSSVLLTGALGSGKTAVAQSLARQLRESLFYHTTYVCCRKLVNDQTRISSIKEYLSRVFMAASWGARLGGKSLVVLDDLDKLCPVETELQVGNDNGRSRQLSETVCSIVRQYCTKDSGVVLLATAQGKDSINNVIIGGHVVREIVGLKAPDKEGRRKILESIASESAIPRPEVAETVASSSRPPTADGSLRADEDESWMSGSPIRRSARPSSVISKLEPTGFILAPDLDFLDIAGSTDGYMPGDLLQLVARARSQALMRSIEQNPDDTSSSVPFSRKDFDSALDGFTPASLRNVTLQTSTTTFSSIGGLQETRKVLLETLQYPTKYAPIFAQCPLRLRSGLLLYGYPGCGKTLLASAVAGECGLNFISVKGPEILNKYIGASEKSVRDLFERASAAKPCVLFFDEFDSIAPKRGHDSTGVTDRVVNQLLTQMDGAEGLSGVYVLAATSRPDLIDPALLRPGRLDKSLLCDFPALEDRVDIVRAMATKIRMDNIVDDEQAITELGRKTEGYTGADLQALMSNAQLEAIHDVLGDRSVAGNVNSQVNGTKKGDAKSSSSGSAPPKNFVQFRYGREEHAAESEDKRNGGFNRSHELAERAAIAAKLEGFRAARRKARHGKNGSDGNNAAGGGGGKEEKDTGEVFIAWRHLTKALEGTRPSISVAERRRLERIYHEFVVGRSGDMKDGQGSMEVGGRSSLM
ncbi:Peroxisome biosynthesis protein pex1 [Zalerion maritima]|uniref:Peroxisomal ATPase PEX1 n=1 Tax=Zalerion maritima TaxID=339359 RepID=A0AAD5RTK2_9PEZI|nr:Peroxisome biosynthesis protein pex1 [Zalerion maritima]